MQDFKALCKTCILKYCQDFKALDKTFISNQCARLQSIKTFILKCCARLHKFLFQEFVQDFTNII